MVNYKTEKTNILHLVVTLEMGGAEIILTQYIQALGNEKYRHYIYCFGYDGPIRERLELLDIDIHLGKKMAFLKNPAKFVLNFIVLVIDVIKYIRKNNIGIIISHLRNANQLACAISYFSGVPFLPVVHSTMEFKDQRNKFDPRRNLVDITNSLTFKSAKRIIAISEEVKQIVKDNFKLKNERVVVVNNGIVVDQEFLKKLNERKEQITYEGNINLLYVGRLVNLKNINIIIKSVYELKLKGLKGISFTIVGDGEERESLEDLAENLDLKRNINFLGNRNDVLSIMKKSDIFIIASKYEGLSIAMIEAMACGLPIIASDAPGINTHIRHEENGLLFQVNDSKELSGNILRLIKDNDLRKRISQAERECYKKMFDMNKNISKLEKQIKICLD